ncbi:MAG: hypothetical protein HKN42_00595, partial [Granulosicoccus sp.]|nr:hypothetical protein [Granulosicoccus sp.]
MNTLPAQRVLLFIYVLLLLVPAGIQAQPAGPALDRFAPDTVLVKFRPGTPAATKAQVHAAANANFVRTLTGTEVLLMRVPSGAVDRSLNAYRNNPNILTADKNYRRVIYLPATWEGSETIGTPPNDLTFQNFNEQWNLHNTGQAFGLTLNYNSTAYLYPSYEGVPDADINAPEAW